MEQRPLNGYGTYLLVWSALVVLTAVTVTVAGLHLARWGALAAILVATIKGSLVLLYFMHLRREAAIIKVSLLVALLTWTVTLALTFADVAFR